MHNALLPADRFDSVHFLVFIKLVYPSRVAKALHPISVDPNRFKWRDPLHSHEGPRLPDIAYGIQGPPEDDCRSRSTALYSSSYSLLEGSNTFC